jgi:hypothetical protein
LYCCSAIPHCRYSSIPATRFFPEATNAKLLILSCEEDYEVMVVRLIQNWLPRHYWSSFDRWLQPQS